MNLEQRFTVAASRQAVWDLLMDVERLGKCFPGVERVELAVDGTYNGTLRVRVGPVSLGLAGNMTIREADRENWRALLHLEGSDRRVGGGVKCDVSMCLTELSAAETELTLTSNVTFMGKLGELGQPIIRKKADTTMQEFARNLAREMGNS